MILSDELLAELLATSMELNGCERSGRGRRWCCAYHEGFEDALDIAQGYVNAPPPPPTV